MDNRRYNIFFHLHTVSGIVISVLLFVIFFAGSFSFFRDEIVNWERNDSVVSHPELTVDFNRALDSISKTNTLTGKDITFKKYFEEAQINVSLSASKDTTLQKEAQAGNFFYLNTQDFSTETYYTSYTLGEFLYRLHFFAQVPYPYGYYLSGFTAFFFLFALITGLLIHWDKIKQNFYVFRPKAKLKTLWTDAHTALGTIGFPFQLVYAVTGTFFMIKLLVVAPFLTAFYNGDQKALYDELGYNPPHFEYLHQPIQKRTDINAIVARAAKKWDDFNITKVDILNYGDANMHVNIEGELNYDTQLTGLGKLCYRVADGKLVLTKNPYTEITYVDHVKNLLYRLHFGDYAGYSLRIISFLLGLIGCVVILSGVLIWFHARNKKNISEKKRKYNNSVYTIYLAICLSMLPTTAISFIAVKLIGNGYSFLYYFYFLVWLVLSVAFSLKNNNAFTLKVCLLSGGILGLLIPVANGITTGNWFWTAFQHSTSHLFIVDVLWILLAAVSLYSYKIILDTSKRKKI